MVKSKLLIYLLNTLTNVLYLNPWVWNQMDSVVYGGPLFEYDGMYLTEEWWTQETKQLSAR